MAALDAVLGTRYEAATSASHTLTTTSAAASGTRIILLAGWTTAPTASHLTSVSGGGLTWVVDRNDDDEGNFFGTAMASAYAASGLASSTVLTMNFDDAGTGQVASAAASFTGMVTGASGYVDLTVAPSPAITAAWSSGTMAATQSDVLVATIYGDNTRTSTTDAPATELVDFNGGGGFNSLTAAYRIVTAGSYTLTGSWDTTPIDWQLVGVGYKATATQPGDDPPLGFSGRGAGW